jgi:hypothetical protein
MILAIVMGDFSLFFSKVSRIAVFEGTEERKLVVNV